ncbi:MAG: tRNA (guanosine(37)-N1)-methyltransferase TrmD [Ruminiclostridium sp.]|nr:tRNA (guanosine(37)-N1)-methyltransferase TrmD [Ruminiclostridium sp.]
MIEIGIATLFPDMCEVVLSESIIGRARKAGAVKIGCRNIRDFALNKHRHVDDKPFGGGTGMVMQAQPIYDCVTAMMAELPEGVKPRLIYMSPQGRTLDQQLVKELAAEESLIILCGHYEGVDRRVLDELAFEEISVGDYVVTGGELPALMLADAVCRLQEGVLPNEDAYSNESHYNGLLEYPQYTRPEEWRGRRVPEVLLSGHHANIKKWQEEMSLEVTREKRPELLSNSGCTKRK